MAETRARVLRLYPPPQALLDAVSVYEDLELSPRDHPDRPHVAINAVSSVNGGAALPDGGSAIAGRTDRATMRTLRSRFDAVLVGASTLRSERVVLLDGEGRRPLLVVPTVTGRVPLEENPGDCDPSNTIVFVPDSLPPAARRSLSRLARVESAPMQNEHALNLGEILTLLRESGRARTLLAEGGPKLNASLVASGLADELYLTIAPKLLIGAPPLFGQQATATPPHTLDRILDLISVHLAGGDLYLRYAFPE